MATDERNATIVGGIVVSLTIILMFTMGLVFRAHGKDLKGEFAQYTPEQRDWLQRQTVPGKTVGCCNVADGTLAEESKDGDKYWVSFEACYFPGNYQPAICKIEGPMPVPPDAVLDVPNKIGRAVVWYGWENKKVWIRCFIPGAGL